MNCLLTGKKVKKKKNLSDKEVSRLKSGVKSSSGTQISGKGQGSEKTRMYKNE